MTPHLSHWRYAGFCGEREDPGLGPLAGGLVGSHSRAWRRPSSEPLRAAIGGTWPARQLGRSLDFAPSTGRRARPGASQRLSARTFRRRLTCRTWEPASEKHSTSSASAPALWAALLHDLAELPWSHGVEDPEACPHDLALGEPQALTQTPCPERFDELAILDREAELSTDDVGTPRRPGASGDESGTDHKGARAT